MVDVNNELDAIQHLINLEAVPAGFDAALYIEMKDAIQDELIAQSLSVQDLMMTQEEKESLGTADKIIAFHVWAVLNTGGYSAFIIPILGQDAWAASQLLQEEFPQWGKPVIPYPLAIGVGDELVDPVRWGEITQIIWERDLEIDIQRHMLQQQGFVEL